MLEVTLRCPCWSAQRECRCRAAVFATVYWAQDVTTILRRIALTCAAGCSLEKGADISVLIGEVEEGDFASPVTAIAS